MAVSMEACGKCGSSTRESEVLGRCVRVLLHAAALKLAARELPEGFWSAESVFTSVDDVVSDVSARLKRALDEYRAPPMDGQPGTRCIGLVEIERSILAIGRDPAIACFLAAGASIRSRRVREACRGLAALLGLALAPDWTVESDAPPR